MKKCVIALSLVLSPIVLVSLNVCVPRVFGIMLYALCFGAHSLLLPTLLDQLIQTAVVVGSLTLLILDPTNPLLL